MQSGNEEFNLPWDTDEELFEVAFGFGDSQLAVAGHESIGSVDLATKAIRHEVVRGGVHRVSFCNSGKWILAGQVRGGFAICNRDTGDPITTFPAGAYCAVLNCDETRVATCGPGGGVFIWNTANGEMLLDLSLELENNRHVFCIAFSPDSQRLAGATGDGRVFVWDAASGKRLHEFIADDGRAYAVVFSRDGKRIMSMGDDGVLRVWHSVTGREVLTLRGHAERVYSLAFTPDGSQLVSASADETIRIWDGRPIDNDDGALP